MGNYLEIAKKTRPKRKTKKADPPGPAAFNTLTTKTTDTTKASTPALGKPRGEKRPANFTPLTVSEALAEINRWGSGAGRNVELYRRGELSEERAVEYVSCAILHSRGHSFDAWKRHAPAVRRALSLCIHELPPEECKVCNGYVKKLIEEGDAA